MSLQSFQLFENRKKFLVSLLFLTLITIGVFAKNNWFPSTDPLSGIMTGWFGAKLPPSASSSWNPFAAPLPTPGPQLSKEYIYAGSRLLAVEDTFANAAPPADLAVWRPSTGVWWIRWSSDGVTRAFVWGSPGDLPVAGDYDSDGKFDPAIWRPSDRTWYVLKSSDETAIYFAWGLASDYPIPNAYVR